jgi:hypothetical protein
MNWLSEQYEKSRREDDLRAAEQEAKMNALLADAQPKPEPKRARQAIGGKLIEWGKRLQETSALSETAYES